MQNSVEAILELIPVGKYFDTRYVINRLIKKR